MLSIIQNFWGRVDTSLKAYRAHKFNYEFSFQTITYLRTKWNVLFDKSVKKFLQYHGIYIWVMRNKTLAWITQQQRMVSLSKNMLFPRKLLLQQSPNYAKKKKKFWGFGKKVKFGIDNHW